jgi:hypothetical protein
MSIFKDFNFRKKNLLITAKNRTGVTSSIMIPAILENDDSNFVILDFNKEIYSITNKYREKHSNVYLIDRNTIIEDINKIDYSKRFTIYICCNTHRENIDEIKIFEEILKIVDNKRVKCIILIEHYEHIANILREIKIGNNNKFLISTQEGDNLEPIKNDLEKFDTGHIILSNNSIYIDNKEYKQDFYFENAKYMEHLNLNSSK